MSRLEQHYEKIIRPDLITKMNYKNVMEIPKIEKICIHMTLKSAITDKRYLQTAMLAIELITGQRPSITKAKKSISTFKLREGMLIGCKVTLRNKLMYDFLDRLVTMVLPRIRDFRGISSNSFDGNGNYSFGIKDFLAFLEIESNYDLFEKVHGVDVHIITTAKNDQESKILLSGFQIPFQ